MLTYFERRAREIDAQSQDSLSSFSGHATTVEVRSSFDKIHLKYTERDEVLQTLLTRAEDNKTATVSSGKKTWVSKWDFNFDKNDKLASTAPVEDEPPSTSPRKPRKSPAKTRQASPAKRASSLPKHLKSIKEKSEDSSTSSDTLHNVPKKKSPLKTNNKNAECPIPSSPYDQIRKPTTGSMAKKRKNPQFSDRLTSKVTEEAAKRLSLGREKQMHTHTSIVDLTFSDNESD